MDTDALARLGAVSCAILVLAIVAPAAVVTDAGSLLADYYAAGPFGLLGLGFLSAVAVVVFLASQKEHTDTATVAGVAAVVGVGVFLLAAIWALSITPTLLYSFPPRYAWLEYHRWTVVLLAAVPAATSVIFAQRVVGGPV